MRLSEATLAQVPAQVARPAYDRDAIRTGIVHIGSGVFHRSHLATYADDALGRCGELAMCGVSLRSPAVRDALRPQDFLYTLAIADERPGFRIIGSVRDILVASEDPGAVVRQLADPGVHTVTVTVTESGYYLGPDGSLDLHNPDIVADLESPRAPATTYGFLVAAQRERRAAGVDPFVVVSCDNLSRNGTLLRDAVVVFARELDRDLASWLAGEVSFPCTMVDSLTPATDDGLRELVNESIGMVDAWPVRRESYRQWIVEAGHMPYEPVWQSVGVTFSLDVESYEVAKLRLLNGQHSALAYLGILVGYDSVYRAANDPDLRAFVTCLSETEIQPSINAPPEFDLSGYAAEVMRRLDNPSLDHQLEKIACDGSLKIPIRTLSVIRENLAAGRPVRCLCLVVAAWINFLGTRKPDASDLEDPLAENLLSAYEAYCADTSTGVRKFLAIEELGVGELRKHAEFVLQLESACDALKHASGAEVGRRLALSL